MSRRTIACLALGTVVALSACSHDGRTLRPARPDQNQSILAADAATTVAPATAGGAAEVPVSQNPMGMTLGGYWEDGGALPIDSTCKGKGLSPDLNWSSIPADAVELVLTVTDAAPDGFVNWVLAGIDPASPGLVQGKIPRGTVQTLNGIPSVGWSAPCATEGTHRYVFSLFALNKPSGILPGMAADDAIAGLTASGAPHASITGTAAA